MRTDVPYAVVTAASYRPGERPRPEDVRPCWVLDRDTSQVSQERLGYVADAFAPNTPAAVMYLRERAEMSVMEFIAKPNYSVTDILAPTLLAFHSDAERRTAFERLDAQVIEGWQLRLRGEDETLRGIAEKRLSRIASGQSVSKAHSYEAHRNYIGSCVFATRPLYAILAPWEEYIDAQVERARMDLLLADASKFNIDSESNSIRALRLFAQRGVALDPSRTFESEIVITYDELFAAFGRGEGSVGDEY